MRGFAVDVNRIDKAKKIDRVLSEYLGCENLIGKKILDIGCGYGNISHYFAKSNTVYAVDVEENISDDVLKNVYFSLIGSEELPFENNFFDIVISNHVVEHLHNQFMHLKEIHRVIKSDGVCYFATPNKNFICEPHYKIPFIHYLPTKYFNLILHCLALYKEDVRLLTHGQILKIIKASGFRSIEFTNIVAKEPNKYHLRQKWLSIIPMKIIRAFCCLMPTSIFIIIPTEKR